MKLIQVADMLHGSIPLTRLEKNVLSTEIFNRLHNVLQNSTAYLTYPSGRHSRLSHSLGCLHVAGEIFHSGVANASREHQSRFVEDANQELGNLIEDSGFLGDLRHLMGTTKVTQILSSPGMNEFDELVVSRHLMGAASVPLVQKPRRGRQKNGDPGASAPIDRDYHFSDRVAFALLLQAVRLAALLHDLGHPPFSHIVESALNDLYVDIKAKASTRRTGRERRFVDILSEFQEGNGKRAKIHEDIGNHLAEHVLSEAVRSYACDEVEKLRSVMVKHLVLRILTDRSSFCRAIHSIVDGELDADRLDYVPRDSVMTGFGGGRFEYARLLSSFQLVYSSKLPSSPLFAPSVQALSSIEDFFQKRLSLYAYVVHHHRVVKTDGLLGEVVRGLAKNYLIHKGRDNGRASQGYEIPSDISGLWRTLDSNTHLVGYEYVRHYIQWDDAWLLTILRRHFFQLEAEDGGRNESRVLIVQLEELLSNRKYYHSLYKRPESFLPLDDAFIFALGQDFDFGPFEERKNHFLKKIAESKRETAELNHIYSRVKKYHEKWFEVEALDPDVRSMERARLRDRNGFFIVDLLYLLDSLGEGGGEVMDFIRQAADDLKAECSLVDVFVVDKRLKIGVDGSLKLVRGDDVIELRDVSQIVGELERRSLYFPRFFVYMYKEGGLRDDEIVGLRQKFAELMASRFRDLTERIKAGAAEEAGA